MLAVLVILFFLRSLRGSFVAAVTIPTTIISTFTFMTAMGFTLNMMSMLALTISVGMIIDDSIVVLENSYRHMEEGKPRMQAACDGDRGNRLRRDRHLAGDRGRVRSRGVHGRAWWAGSSTSSA